MLYKTQLMKQINPSVMLDISMYYTPPHLVNGSSYLHVFTNRVQNSKDPEQLGSQKPADLNLNCFQNRKQ